MGIDWMEWFYYQEAYKPSELKGLQEEPEDGEAAESGGGVADECRGVADECR